VASYSRLYDRRRMSHLVSRWCRSTHRDRRTVGLRREWKEAQALLGKHSLSAGLPICG